MDTWGKSVLSRRYSQCKCPETGVGLACNSKQVVVTGQSESEGTVAAYGQGVMGHYCK